jgi:type IV pilus assembly protein PilO
MDKLKQWVLLTVVGCLAVLAAGWFLLISPKKAEATDLVAQTAAQEAANDGLRTQLQVLKAQAKDLPKKQADLARVATKIPDNPAMPSLIRALTAAATSAGVELVSVTPGVPVAVEAPVGAAPVAPAAAQAVPAPAAAAPAGPVVPGTAPAGAPAGALATIPLSINVIGGYFEVSQFLADLEGLPRALRVTNLTLAPGTSPTAVVTAGAATAPAVPDGRTLTTTITGSVFLAANRPPAAAVVAPVG